MHVPVAEHPSAVVPHGPHCAPPIPHAPAVVGETHALLEQHPLAHEAAVHSHDSPVQTCPGAHWGLAPQRHAPEGEQLSERFIAQVVQLVPSVPQLAVEAVSHRPLASQQPVAHDAELHTHFPATHCCPGWHCAPPPQLH